MNEKARLIEQLNKLGKKIMGRPMNAREKALLSELRERVKNGELSKEEALKIWRLKA